MFNNTIHSTFKVISGNPNDLQGVGILGIYPNPFGLGENVVEIIHLEYVDPIILAEMVGVILQKMDFLKDTR